MAASEAFDNSLALAFFALPPSLTVAIIALASLFKFDYLQLAVGKRTHFGIAFSAAPTG